LLNSPRCVFSYRKISPPVFASRVKTKRFIGQEN